MLQPSLRALVISCRALPFLGLLLAPVSADILYREHFSGSGDEPLAGRPPSIRSGGQGTGSTARWIGPGLYDASRIHADGALRIPSVDHEGASAFLPFSPVSGVVYKLSFGGVSVRSGDWAGAGFSVAPSPAGNVRFRDNKPAFWSLIRRVGSALTDQTFSGPEVVGVADTSVTSSSSLTILLDTTGARWSVKWFYDGRLARSGVFTPLAITHVGFGFNTTASVPTGVSTISLFTLETIESGADTDNDGLPDHWEFAHFRVAAAEDASAVAVRQGGGDDSDGDGYTNLEEYVAGSSPTNPRSVPLDIDGDGLADAWEIHHFGSIDALSANPAADPDRDGISNLHELRDGTNPLDAESRLVPAAQTGASTTPVLEVARNGNDVFLGWTLPAGNFRQVEIHRNDQPVAAGRALVATVMSPTVVFLDQVPSDTASYWYWLGLAGPDGKTRLHGPFTSPKAQVWQP